MLEKRTEHRFVCTGVNCVALIKTLEVSAPFAAAINKNSESVISGLL